MATWLGTLSQFVEVQGYNEVLQKGMIQNQLDNGLPKFRRRYTAVPQVITCSVLLNISMVMMFKNFYVSIVLFGSLKFDWVCSIEQMVCTMSFMEESKIIVVEPAIFCVIMKLLIWP